MFSLKFLSNNNRGSVIITLLFLVICMAPLILLFQMATTKKSEIAFSREYLGTKYVLESHAELMVYEIKKFLSLRTYPLEPDSTLSPTSSLINSAELTLILDHVNNGVTEILGLSTTEVTSVQLWESDHITPLQPFPVGADISSGDYVTSFILSFEVSTPSFKRLAVSYLFSNVTLKLNPLDPTTAYVDTSAIEIKPLKFTYVPNE